MLTGALTVVACGGDDGAGQVSAGETSLQPEDAQAVDVGEAYLRDLAGEDGRSLEDALAVAAPGSIADGYARHTQAVNEIRVEAGEAPEEQEVTVEGDTVIVSFTTGDGSTVPVEWSDFEVDDQGLLTDFTIEGQSLEDRLVIGDEAVVTDDVAVTLVSAFERVTNDSPVVVVEIDNGSDRTYSPVEVAYAAPDGTVEPTAPTDGATVVPPGAENRLLLTFDPAPFGGEVVIRGDLDGTATEHRLSVEARPAPVAGDEPD